jgi:rubredoxin
LIKLWRCEVCGYLHEGEYPPDICPNCGFPKENFVLLDEEETQLMVDARQTKEKYNQIYQRLEEIISLAREGIELDLDEGCNKTFSKTVDAITDIHKMIKDELAGHAAVCIWVKVASDGERKGD